MFEYPLSIKVEELEEGGYLATSDVLQRLVDQGRTMAETIEIAQDVTRKLIESCIEHGDPLPFVSGKKFIRTTLSKYQQISCSFGWRKHSIYLVFPNS